MLFAENDLERARALFDAEAEGVLSLKGSIGPEFLKALEMFSSIEGRIIVSGMGKSGLIGRKVAATFSSTGTPAFFLHPAEASHGDLGMLTIHDGVLALSLSGETAELNDIITFTRRFHIPLVAITGNSGSILAKAADVTLLLPALQEACPHGLAPTTSTAMILALGDALAICLFSKKELSKEDFKRFHPGGKLGKKLLTVADIMHTAEDLPLVKETASMQEVLPVITQKALGCVGVVDKKQRILGIITDGDIRRHMGPDFLMQIAKDVMTVDPFTLPQKALAFQALQHMNAHKITNLFVVNEDKTPQGVIHIHDCLRAGLA